MSRKKFINSLNEFLHLVDKFNLIKTDNSNLIYSFGGNRSNDVLSYKIRDQLHKLVESFKNSKTDNIEKYSNGLKQLLNSSFLLGEIDQKQLNEILGKMDDLIDEYNGAVK